MAGALLILSTVLHVVPLLLASVLKAAIPIGGVRKRCDKLLMAIAESWIGCNSWMFKTLTDTRLEVRSDAKLRPDGHYLVLANHQSWVDIPVLQRIFNRRIPLLRFFLKSQLIWVPLLGLAWWALDFPFMKRYSRETLARRPELAGRDRAATRRACAKFKDTPVSIMNFVEGTRFAAHKHRSGKSPYAHLLKPKSGGVAFVLDAMGRTLNEVLDVTIVYPEGQPTILDLFANRIGCIRVDIRSRPIPVELLDGDYDHDSELRERFRRWINELWSQKDATFGALLEDGVNGP